MGTEKDKNDSSSTKQISKELMRPFAIMRLFHEAARIGFNDLRQCLNECQNNLSAETTQTLLSTFKELEACIAIHKDHEDKGLYPALLSSVNHRLKTKNYNPSKQKLEEGLKEIPSFSDEHKEDHQILNELDALLNALVDIVNNNQDNDEKSKS